MKWLALRAYGELLALESYLAKKNFCHLYDKVRSHTVRERTADSAAVTRVCQAVDEACIWYWKHVLCLQRSAVATCLLRSEGVPAELVLGVQQLPFRAHAWVEVGGVVVNDKPYVSEIYKVLDRL